jgi:hypothetical protein
VLGIADELTYEGLLLRYRSREQTMRVMQNSP